MKTKLFFSSSYKIQNKIVSTIILVFIVCTFAIGQTTVGPNNTTLGANLTTNGTIAWANPTNIYTDNAAYASVSIPNNTAESHYLYASRFGFSIPAAAIINGITVNIDRYASANSISDVKLYLVKIGGTPVGTNKANTAFWPNADGVATYGGTADLWGTTWAPSEINNTGFGVVLSVKANGTNKRAYVDYISISVTYTLPPPDPCASAITITGTGSANSKTFSVTTGAGAWNTTFCNNGGSDGKEQVYSFTPTTTGNYKIVVTSTAGYWVDYHYQANNCAATGWNCLVASNGTSPAYFNSPGETALFSLNAGTTYYFLLESEDATQPSVQNTFYIDLLGAGYIISDPTTVTTCNGNFYDDGGSAGDYNSNANFVKTFVPATAGSKMSVHFNSFNVEENFDFLYVYDGPNTSSPQVIGSPFSGTNVPADIISTAIGGELTFKFTSDGSTTCLGWEAVLSCFTPGPMTYSSSTVTQATTNNISTCSLSEPIICIQVVTTGALNPLSLTEVKLQMAGTAPTNAIDKIHIYYTGTTPAFGAINAFNGVGTAPSAGIITISGNQQLQQGTNYFWIAYDMTSTATLGNTVDAKIIVANGITVGGTALTPTEVDPTGSRTIVACTPSPGGVSTNLSAWYKADNGITLSGGNVSEWANSGGSATGFNLSQSTATYMPALVSSVDYKFFNYNKKIRFNGSSSYMENSNNTPDLIGVDAGSFFIVLSKDAIDGSALCYKNNSDYAFQFKPKFRMQSGKQLDAGSTIDIYNPSNSLYSTYFPSGEWADDAAFITFAQGINTAINIAINSKFCDTKTNTSSYTYAPDIGNGLCIGRNNGNSTEYISSDIGEIIFYSANLSSYDKNRIESYLAIKYGVTRGNNSGTTSAYNYISAGGVTIFDKTINNGYNNDIAGIARDDASGLNQKQSISVNTTDILTIGLGTIATENSSNSNTFPKDKSFVVWGNNGLATISNTSTMIPAAAATLPAAIESRLPRVWKMQNVNFIGSGAGGTTPTVKVGFETFGLVNYTSLDKLRLLMDNDGVNWSNAWVSGATAVLNGTRIEFPNITLNATQPYLTLASINLTTTPLPVQIKEFNVICDKNETLLTWETASEINNKFFTLERSTDLINWDWVATIEGAGNSNSLKKYSYTDINPSGVQTYYRLKQTDFDGRSETFIPITTNCKSEMSVFICFPNPFNDELFIKSNENINDDIEVVIRNISGQIVYKEMFTKESFNFKGIALQLSTLSFGTYIFEFKAGNYVEIQKIVKDK